MGWNPPLGWIPPRNLKFSLNYSSCSIYILAPRHDQYMYRFLSDHDHTLLSRLKKKLDLDRMSGSLAMATNPHQNLSHRRRVCGFLTVFLFAKKAPQTRSVQRLPTHRRTRRECMNIRKVIPGAIRVLLRSRQPAHAAPVQL